MVQKCSCAMAVQSNGRNSQILLASFLNRSLPGVLVAVASRRCYLSSLDELILVGNGVHDEHAFTRTRCCVVQREVSRECHGYIWLHIWGRAPSVAMATGVGVKCGMDAKCPLKDYYIHTLLVAGRHLLVVT